MTETPPVPYEFDKAVELTRRDDGVLAIDALHQAWNVGDFYNGGYLHALTARAAQLAADAQPDPIAVTTTFVAPVRDEPAELHVDLLSIGRTVSTAQVRLIQSGQTRVQSIVTLGELPATVSAPQLPMPDVPAPDESTVRELSGGSPAWSAVTDMRFVPGHDGWIRGEFNPDAEFMAWLRFRDGRPLDALSVIAFSDMAPPAAFAMGRFGWAPTLQLMVGTFAQPTGEWVLMHIHGAPYGDGAHGCEDTDIWDTSGTLVGRARQIALLPRPRSGRSERSGR